LRSTPQYRAFSGRQQLLYDFYDKEVYVDDLESRQNDLDCELGFRPRRTAAD
jgi:hypothetical protein